MATCAVCAGRKRLRLGGLSISWPLAAALVTAAIYGLLTWWMDFSHHLWPFAAWAHHSAVYLVGHYLIATAFFGSWMYFMYSAALHLPHSGRDWWRAVLLLLLKLAMAFAAFAGAMQLLISTA